VKGIGVGSRVGKLQNEQDRKGWKIGEGLKVGKVGDVAAIVLP